METDNVKQRLKEVVKYLGLSQRGFNAVIGVSASYINGIRKSIQPDVAKSIAINFPKINTGWIMTGEGTMLKGDKLPPPPPPSETAAPQTESREWLMIESQYKLLSSQSKQTDAIIRSLNRRDEQMDAVIAALHQRDRQIDTLISILQQRTATSYGMVADAPLPYGDKP